MGKRNKGQRPSVGAVLQAFLYIGAGANHLLHPGFYLRIMPDHYTHPALWVRWTGVAEILGGLGLLLPATRRFAAGGICLMLLGYFDVHLWMLHHPERFPHIPLWLLWARLPLQLLLIAWAAHYLQRNGPPGQADPGIPRPALQTSRARLDLQMVRAPSAASVGPALV